MKINHTQFLAGRLSLMRKIEIGGLTKSDLLEELRRNAISLNHYAEQLFSSDRFTTAKHRYSVATVEVSGRDLGFRRGATTSEIYARAEKLGLALGPLELAPHLRLQYRDQPGGANENQKQSGRAPFGSLTVASSHFAEHPDGRRASISSGSGMAYGCAGIVRRRTTNGIPMTGSFLSFPKRIQPERALENHLAGYGR